MSATSGLALAFNNTAIRDREQHLSLTDMWKAAGSDPARKPAHWLRSDTAREFVGFIAETLRVAESQLVSVVRGDGGCTWAHWQLAFAYAKYLSPAFHAWCNEVVRAYMEQRSAPPSLPAPASAESPAWFREQMAKVMERLTALEAQRGDRFPSGLIGNREAAVYIRGPLLSLARQLASVRGASVQSVLMSLEREVRRACDHPKEEKGRTWGRLPAGKFDQAVLTISLLQVKAQEELKDYARRVAREAQVSLPPG